MQLVLSGRRAGLALAVLAIVTTSALPVADSAGVVSQASAASCTYARVGGVRKCLRTGEFCARARQSDYRRAGFRCTTGSDGRARLRKS